MEVEGEIHICGECRKGNHRDCLDPSGILVDEDEWEVYCCCGKLIG